MKKKRYDKINKRKHARTFVNFPLPPSNFYFKNSASLRFIVATIEAKLLVNLFPPNTFSLLSLYNSTISWNCFSALSRVCFKISSHSRLTRSIALPHPIFSLKTNRLIPYTNCLKYTGNDEVIWSYASIFEL